ncbi:MAG: hypothetical protein GPJ51_01770 [Candidatus Heimdallarchaeota archaeon]|nr:hypothetical protein [Candidatus Heimdallarchaeota archaeon]
MMKTEEGFQTFEDQLTLDQLKEDYLLLRSSLEEGHAGLYAHRSKTEIDTEFDTLHSRLNSPITLLDFYKIIATFIDFIADGHTSVNFNTQLRELVYHEIGVFPIQPSLINNRFYVYRNFSENNSISMGTEILKIDNISVKEIIENLLPFVFIDGFGYKRKFRLLEKNFSKLFPLVYGAKNTFEIECRVFGSKEIKIVELQAMTIEEIKGIQEKRFPEILSDSLFDLTIHSAINTAVLRIGTFNSGKAMAKLTGIKRYENEDKFTKFLKKSFRRINEEKVETLVIDLRGNTGGRDDYGALLYSYLTETDFQYYDGLYLKKKKYDFFKTTNNNSLNFILSLIRKEETDLGFRIHNPFFMPPLYKIHKKQKNAFEGDLFILIDGGSFSAACELLTTCHRFQRAKFVGEETRGAFIGNTSGLMANVRLPNSKLIIRIPMFRYMMPVSQENNHRGITPDYEIKSSIEDIVDGKDTALKYTLEHLTTML